MVECWEAVTSCWQGWFSSSYDEDAEQALFERHISFLSTVPLLHAQIPAAELPKVASVCQEQVWDPQSVIVHQGDPGQALFIVVSGEASILVYEEEDEEEDDDFERELSRLVAGDYFGERCLAQDGVLNPATICASTTVVTLSIKRADLERLGLSTQLTLPRRLGIYGGEPQALSNVASSEALEKGPAEKLTDEDAAFLKASIRRCPHLRALGGIDEDHALDQLVRHFRKKTIKAGDDLVRGAELVSNWYIICWGSCDIIPIVLRGGGRGKSAETVVSTDKVVDVITRKHKMLLALAEASGDNLLQHVTSAGSHKAPLRISRSENLVDFLRGGRRSSVSFGQQSRRRLSASTLGSKASPTHPHSTTFSTPRSVNRASTVMNRSRSERFGITSWVSKLRRRASRAEEELKDDKNLKAAMPFKVGDRVALVTSFNAAPSERSAPSPSGTATRSVGCIVDFCRTESGRGECLVDFPKVGVQRRPVDLLASVEDLAVRATMGRGESIGEIALLYNARALATARAREDCEVFELPRSHFKRFFSKVRDKKIIDSYLRLLDQVDILAPLLRAERRDLAGNANGFTTFSPGEIVLRAGQAIETHTAVWYIVASGSCTVTAPVPGCVRKASSFSQLGSPSSREGAISRTSTSDIEEYVMGDYFGERHILSGEFVSDINVQAGPEGLVCLTIDAAVLRGLKLRTVGGGDEDFKVLATTRHNGHHPRTHVSRAMFRLLSVLSVLGEGGFGQVLLVRHPSGQLYALKKLSRAYINEEGFGDQVRSERDIMSILDCPFIVHFYQSHRDDTHVYMLMEAALGGDLVALLCNAPEVLLADHPRGSAAMYYIASISCGLGYLHERYIAYRDVKLENMLLDSEGQVKICDMGFARFVRGKTHTFLGTPDYMAPEVIDAPHAHNVCIDWWSLGVLACELLTGQSPWRYRQGGSADLEGVHQVLAVRQAHRHVEASVRRAIKEPTLLTAQDFVKQLLTVKPHRRLGYRGVGEVHAHAWFTSSNFDFQALRDGRMAAPYRPSMSAHIPTADEGTSLEEITHGMIASGPADKALGQLASSQMLLSTEGCWDDAF